MVEKVTRDLYFDGRFYATVPLEFWESVMLILEEDGNEALIAALEAEGYTHAQIMELAAIARVQLRGSQIIRGSDG